MCLRTKDIKGIVADRDIPCIKLLFNYNTTRNIYRTICRCVPVKLGKLMVAEGTPVNESFEIVEGTSVSKYFEINEGYIHSYMCAIHDFDTCYSFDVAVRAYIPKGSTYCVDMDNIFEVCSPSLFVTDEILFTYSEYKNHSINSTHLSTDIGIVSNTVSKLLYLSHPFHVPSN